MFLLDTNHYSYAILGNTQILDRLATLEIQMAQGRFELPTLGL
jgi:hypothetical protein